MFEAAIAKNDGAAVPAAPRPMSDHQSLQMPVSREPTWSRGMHHSRGSDHRNNHGQIGRRFLRNTDVAELCQRALHSAYGAEKSVAKTIALDTGISAKAAENWMAADNPMSLTAFLNAFHNNAAFKAWARKILLMEEDHDPAFQAELARFMTVVQQRGRP